MNQEIRREQGYHPRTFSDFMYAYPVLSRRSGGVSIGINLNIDKLCNFDCPYCQVDRVTSKAKQAISINAIKSELESLLMACDSQGVLRIDRFARIPDHAKHLMDLAISGDGEQTMVPEFFEVCAMLARLQASRSDLDFKLVLITNSTLLSKQNVLKGIDQLLSKNGEVWAKLDAGTEAWYQKVNVSRVTLDTIESNLIKLGRSHAYKIQSLFCGLEGELPSTDELDAYLARLQRIKAAGSRIQEVQLHTLARKPAQEYCTPVSSAFLENLRTRIETQIELPTKIYGLES